MEPKRNGEPESLKALQFVVGLFAAGAALIYITGGLILGLRLLFAGLPALGVVGQLPREFLFSLGVSLVVAPAVLLGAAAGVIEMGQGDESLLRGHRSWSSIRQCRKLRRTYLAFYSGAPIVLLSPGLVVAVLRDEEVSDRRLVVGVVVVAALVEIAIWVTLARRSRLAVRDDACTPGQQPELSPAEWVWIFSGAALSLLFAAFAGSAKYVLVLAAWAVGLLVALLVVWIRSQVGVRYQAPEARNKVAVGLVSWIASAIFVVPMLVTVAGAWPLAGAVLCSAPTDNTSHPVVGDFVGESKEHTYLGSQGQIVSVPSAKVTRLIVGEDATDSKACKDRPHAASTTSPKPVATTEPPKIMGLLRQTVQVDSAGRFLLGLRPFREQVTGVAQLISAEKVPAAGGRRLKISTHSFRADAGATVRIRFALSALALGVVRRRGWMLVSARITARGMAGTARTTRPQFAITAPSTR